MTRTTRTAVCTLSIILLTSFATESSAEVYDIDPVRSRVRFEIGHAHYAHKVEGRFGEVTGTITIEPGQPERSAVDVVIRADSISTANRFRDSHLRDNFFETESYPEILFESSRYVEGEVPMLDGLLTIKGITRPVTLNIDSARVFTDGRGRRVLRYRATGSILRHDFGVRESRDTTSTIGKVISRLKEGLDQLIDDAVDIDIVVVAYGCASGSDQ